MSSSEQADEVQATEAQASAAQESGATSPQEGSGDIADALDIARGELNDDDLDGLEQAIGTIDFATRKATPERLTRLKGLLARLTDLAGQIEQGVRRPSPERGPLTAEEEARYQALIDEGIAAGERGNLEGAIQKLGEAVLLDPEGVAALFNLGVVYGQLAHMNIARAEFFDDYTRDEVYVERAKLCYDKVLELEPDHLPSLRNLATLYAMREERDLARELLERVIQVAPQDEEDKRLIAAAKRQLAEL